MLLIKLWTILLTLIVAIPQPTMSYRRVATKDMRYSVLLHLTGVKVNKEGVSKPVGFGCSGTYIAPTKIITAAHCFDGYEFRKAWARGPADAVGYPVRVVLWDRSVDLAVVEAAFPHPYATVGPPPSVGDEVLNIGSPLGFEFVASQGIVSVLGATCLPFLGSYTITTAFIDHGSSGGGAFDKKGRLIGVNTMSIGMFGWSGLTLAVDVATIRGFLYGA